MRLREMLRSLRRHHLPVADHAADNPAEAYYASVYLDIIDRHLMAVGRRPANVVDVGCGSGRLLIPLAELGHQVTGIDNIGDNIRQVTSRLKSSSADVRLIEGDFQAIALELPQSSFDVVIAAEVLYFNVDPRKTIATLAALARPGGLLFITHRTRHYYILYCLAQGNYDDAYLVATTDEGKIRKGGGRRYFNWQTQSGIDEIYDDMRATILEKHPIGPYSGFGNDGHAAVSDPGALSIQELDILRKIERSAGAEVLAMARYVLVVAQVPTDAKP